MDGWDVAEVDFTIDQWIEDARFPLPGDKPGYGSAQVVLDGTSWIRLADGRVVEQQFNMRYEAEGKSYLTLGVGCTGGRHRSVAIAEALGAWFSERDIEVVVRHRDLTT